VLPVDTEAALGAAHRIDAVIRPDFRRALVAGIGAIIALSVGSAIGNGIYSHKLETKLIICGLALVFVILAVLAIRSAANEVQRVVTARGGASAGTTVRLLITLFGYLIVLLTVLGMLAIPLGRLLVGGAITGIVVGIAAQQSLGNIFAGLVLLLARPYVIGERIRVRSGSLGGPIDGTVAGMDLLYTTLDTDEGLIRLPNAGLLAAAVGLRPKQPDAETPDDSPDTQVTTQLSGLPDGKDDADRHAPYDNDRAQDPVRDPARHSGPELGADDRAEREYPGHSPRR
jgi:hypothetical protein